MFFCCICQWKSIYQHYFTTFVDTLLSTVLHPSFHQTLALALWLSVMVENYQVKFSLPQDKQLKSIPWEITTKNYFSSTTKWFVKIQLNSQGSGLNHLIDFIGTKFFLWLTIFYYISFLVVICLFWLTCVV